MASILHPFDNEVLYELNDDGNIRVSRGNSVGIFTPHGVHLSGDLKHADPQLCVWVGNNPDPDSMFRRPGRNTVIGNTDNK